MENQKVRQIDFVKIYKTILSHKRSYCIVLPITFVVSCLLIVCVPRYYTCSVSLVPEMSNVGSSSLSSLASSFGVNMSDKLGNMSDAFSPEIYPDIVSTTKFKVDLFPVKVRTIDNKVNTDYYTYLLKYQKYPWWKMWAAKVAAMFADRPKDGVGAGKGVNPFMLTKKQTDITYLMDANIKCAVDKKTQIISIQVKDQDPLICATMADTIRCRLQDFITNYRTSKARADLAYVHNLYVDAKRQYEKARQRYATFSDANTDVVLESVRSKQEDLENEMQLQYNNYTNMATQYQSAIARLRERTPAFTLLQRATVPIKPAGPKRMIFVATMVFVAFVTTTLYHLIKGQKNA